MLVVLFAAMRYGETISAMLHARTDEGLLLGGSSAINVAGAIRLANDPHALAESLRAAGQGSMEPLHGHLPGVRVPTLVVGGALDRVGGDRAGLVATAISGARLELVAGAGHTPHLERPETFRRIVLAFLQEDLAA